MRGGSSSGGGGSGNDKIAAASARVSAVGDVDTAGRGTSVGSDTSVGSLGAILGASIGTTHALQRPQLGAEPLQDLSLLVFGFSCPRLHRKRI